MKKSTRRKIRTTIYIIILLLLFALSSYIDTHYNREATVTTIEDNVVVFTDTVGYTWEATDVENIVEGQTVVLKMHTNHTTNNISDDIILKIKPTAICMQ